jgi:hypothetical protein
LIETSRLSFISCPRAIPSGHAESVDPKGYIFISSPTDSGGVIESIEGLQEDQTGKQFYDSDHFRYVRVPDRRVWGGTLPNVRVPVMVFGYKAEELPQRFRPDSES